MAKPKKKKLKDSAGKSKQPTAPVSSQPETATAAADADATAAADGAQPAAKPKRKRKSKVAIPDTAVAAATAAEALAEAPAGPSAEAPASLKSKGRKPKDTSSALPGSWRANQARTDVKRGQFTKQEKDTLKQAARLYAQEHSLAESSDDFSWLFNTRSSGNRKDVAGAWQTIAQSLPHRTYKSVYACGTRMLNELNYQV